MALRLRRGLPSGRTRLLGIVGDPIDHSLSPALHTDVLRQLDRDLLYVPVPVSASRLRDFVKLAPALGFLGVNVTTPFKESAAKLAYVHGSEQWTGMINTLCFPVHGKPLGTGTDGPGVMRWLESLSLDDAPLCVLGFGPTARSITAAAWQERRRVSIVTRDPARTRRWLARARRAAPRAYAERHAPRVVGWRDSELSLERGRRTILSTLPAGTRALPIAFSSLVARGDVWLDLNYGEGRTPLLSDARAQGLRGVDGVGALLEQAALSLSMWLGEEVPSRLFRRALGRPASSYRPTH